MANIVIAFHDFWGGNIDGKTKFTPFYESLIYSLISNGNNVLCYMHNVYKYDFKSKCPQFILDNLKEFNPDLFILFNNSFFDISNDFDCPIIIYDVDCPNAYANKENLILNKDRYIFVCQQKEGAAFIKDTIGTKNITYIPPYTSINQFNKKTLSKDKKITFCGSVWFWDGIPEMIDYMRNNPDNESNRINKKIIEEVLHCPIKEFCDCVDKKELKNNKIINIRDKRTFIGRMSASRRFKTLQSISDLGLNIYGNYWKNQPCMAFFPELALSFIDQPCLTISEWENVFNSSHIGFQIGHLQATSGFSWKVIDIMATNACIVTNYCSDLDQLFGKSKIPTYTSEYEARELCKKILDNPNMENDIVSFCHEQIEKYFRPERALAQLEDISGLNLLNQSKNKGKLRINNNFIKKTNHLSNIDNFKQHVLKITPNISKKDFSSIKEKIVYKIWKRYSKDLLHDKLSNIGYKILKKTTKIINKKLEINNRINNRIIPNYINDLYKKASYTNKNCFEKYKNSNFGKHCVLVASGPTVNYYAPLEKAVHCAVNGSFMFDKVNYDYYFAQDYKAVKSYIEDSFTESMKNVKRFYGFFSPYIKDFLIPESVALRHQAARYYMHSLFYGKDYQFPYTFAENLAVQPIICHGTIALTAMQFLLWTNPQKIYLVGCDVTMNGHFNSLMGEQQMASSGLTVWHNGWTDLKDFIHKYYPETEVISINPVGLKGLFHDVYTESYLADHPEIDRASVEILKEEE